MTDMSWKLEDAVRQAEKAEKSSASPEVRKGLLAAGLFFGGLLGWAALTPLDAGAVAQGVVAVSGNRQAVQHRDGGIVSGLNVSEGQYVREGDVLLQISEGQVLAAERGMAGEYVTLLAQRARLEAELNGQRTFSVPAEFAKLPQRDQPLAKLALRGQRQLFDARMNAMSGERSVLNQRVLQQGAQISAYNHQIGSNRKQQSLIREELTGMREMAEKGYVPQNRIRAMERNEAELDGNFGALGAEVSKSQEAIGETRMQMAAISRQRIEAVATEMRDVQLRLGELEPKLIATRDQLARAEVRAPASGRIVGLRQHTVGGVVAPGETIMEIVPDNKALVIDAKASPSDADDLKIGMETQIRFSSIQERNLPILHGQVTKVSADSFEDERTGMKFFKIELSVAPAELAKIKAVRGEVAVKAGLPVDVVVPLRKRSALSYLLEPLTQLFWLTGREQ